MSTTSAVLEVRNLTKAFGNVVALNDVSFTVGAGEVVGLVGDNGAGKSTLVNLLMGFIPPSSGSIVFNGVEAPFKSPAESRLAGIEPVYQHTALIDLMCLWRNFYLGRERTRGWGPFRILDKKAMQKECMAVMNDIGVHVRSGDEMVDYLSGGERQSICIGRCMSFRSKLLLLDEPTVALSVKETQKVLDFIVAVKKQGLSEIIVDHNIFHIFPVVDKFIVLDRGEKLAELRQGEVSAQDIVEIVKTGKRKA
jgi:simple sugar transport system ATP-binding protein